MTIIMRTISRNQGEGAGGGEAVRRRGGGGEEGVFRIRKMVLPGFSGSGT